MDTLLGSGANVWGAQCMDTVTAGLIALAFFAIVVLTGSYALAGICKRVR